MLLVAPGGAAPLFRSFLGAIEGVVGTPYDLRLAAGAFEPEASTLEHAVQSLESFVRESMSMPVHLVGHSGGGAVALAFAAAHPRLLASLTASEPPWVGSSEAGNIGFLDDLRRVVELPTDEVSGAFARLYAASDDVVAELPPFDDAQVRILRAVAIEYQRAHLDLDKLQEVDVPVLLPYGSATPRTTWPSPPRGSLASSSGPVCFRSPVLITSTSGYWAPLNWPRHGWP